MFDPQRIATDDGRAELHKLATRYCRVAHDAIRRHGWHHLILGDRYEAAASFVDVLSFRDFKDPVKHLREWPGRTGKPVLWADGTRQLPMKDASHPGGKYSRNDGVWWDEMLGGIRNNPGCVGAHLCGTYL